MESRRERRKARRQARKEKRMANKKPFGQTAVGTVLKGVAGTLVPALGPILQNGGTIAEVLDAVNGSQLDPNQKVELQKAIFEAQRAEEESLAKRVESDRHHAFTRNIRPALAILYTALFMGTLFLDAFPSIPFNLSPDMIRLLGQINMTIIGFWFGGRTIEKIKGI